VIWSGRRRGFAIAFLSSAAFVLVLANLAKRGVLTWDTLKAHKEALESASSGLSILVVFVGAVLSYFRFFHGRTFSTRAELDMTVQVYSLPNRLMLHVIALELKNIGGSAIWDPQPFVSMTIHGPEGTRPGGEISEWPDVLPAYDAGPHTFVVDTGETARFAAQRTFDPGDWSVTYMASVRCDSGDIWKHIKIVRNASSDSETNGSLTT
jgi:hypothetical protein